MADSAVLPVTEDQLLHALNLFREEQYSQAALALAEILKNYESGELWNDWATAQLMCNQVEESEQGYRRALELDPQSNRAAGNLGVLLVNSGRISEAMPLLERAANGSAGWEREQLLRSLQACREKIAAAAIPGDAKKEDSFARMAAIVLRQSQMIADLWGRVAALEAKAAVPARVLPSLAAGPASHDALTTLLRKEKVASQNSKHSNSETSLRSLPGTIAEGRSQPSGPELPPVTRAVTQQLPAVPREHSPKPGAPQPGVYFDGLIYGASGYAEEGWAAALGLTEHQVPVQLAPMGEPSDREKLIPEASRKKLEFLERLLVDIPESVVFQSGPAPVWNLNLAGRFRVGRTMFETDRIPEIYREACNAMDEVWVPSRFNMETFAKGGVKKRKLRLVPGGVDTHIFCPGAAPLEIPRKRRFNFLSVFDWHRRRGYDVLLRAYLQEFTPDDDVALILKVYQLVTEFSDLEAKISHFIERIAGLPMEIAPAIILINGFIPQCDMARLYAAADAFVLPSRGEAYGRPYLEAMACRLPVIATKWSGQLDFLNNQNSYLIESQITPVPSDVEIEEYKGHLWAEPSADHLRELMRDVYSHPEKARKKADQARKDVVQNYDWSAVIPQWVAGFQRLLS